LDDQIWFEHKFWLQILGDHSRFIYFALSAPQENEIRLARQFIGRFDDLLLAARQENGTELMKINQHAYGLTMKLREFKLELLDKLLLNEMKISLAPTFLNHMLNELEEYWRILSAVIEGKPVPRFPSLHHDLLWLPDAAGHAASIGMELDAVEKRLIKKSMEFEEHFNAFYLKAIELTGYFRTMREHYPALTKFHKDVNLEMNIFMAFLTELEEQDISAELLNRLDPLVPDHMFREECYYLLKLSQNDAITAPDCDPAKPRVGGAMPGLDA
jgi:hypothetical protein